MTGSAWTIGSVDRIKGQPYAWKILIMAAVCTVVTCGLAIGFGELSRVNRNIQVGYQGEENSFNSDAGMA